jgi:nitrite reductase/ring-hydroxylating ferredoxin subunit
MTATVASIKTLNPWSWYAVAASQDLGPGKILPIVLSGENIVVWRAHDGRASAWRDRCPHRGMRLSLGATSGDSLVCPYHGWTFGPDGHCHHIPAHPQLTPSRAARARIYPVAEQNGYVWVCLGEPSSSRPHAIADMIAVRTLHVPADLDVAIASLMTCIPEIEPAADGTLWRTLGEPTAWQIAEGSVACAETTCAEATCSETVGDRRFSASMELPGVVSCTLSDGDAGTVRYRALVQPTDPRACAIHLAVAPPGMPALKLVLNRFLVALRRDLPRLGKSPAVLRVLDAFGRMVPEQVPA